MFKPDKKLFDFIASLLFAEHFIALEDVHLFSSQLEEFYSLTGGSFVLAIKECVYNFDPIHDKDGAIDLILSVLKEKKSLASVEEEYPVIDLDFIEEEPQQKEIAVSRVAFSIYLGLFGVSNDGFAIDKSIEDLAVLFRRSEEEVKKALKELEEVGLLDRKDDGCLVIVDNL